MFVYCLNVLHLSEGETNLRIAVARAVREHPVLQEMLGDGRLHLSGIGRLAPVLTSENRECLLRRAIHKSKREIEEIVAEIDPRPDAPSVIRKLPQRPTAAPPQATGTVELAKDEAMPVASDEPLLLAPVAASRPCAAPPPVFQPLSPGRFKVQFTAGPELRDDLERLRALMRSEVPDGDLAVIVGKAVRELRRRMDARRFAQTKSPRKQKTRTIPFSRYLPADVRRLVYERDASRCRFTDPEGRRCPERHRLEYHHRYPFGMGGDHDPRNVCLMCGPHNRLIAELDYGRKLPQRESRTADHDKKEGAAPAVRTPRHDGDDTSDWIKLGEENPDARAASTTAATADAYLARNG
jgi:hypothetical protein